MPLPAWRSSGSGSSRRSRAPSSLPAMADLKAACKMGRGQLSACASRAHRRMAAVAAVPRWAGAVCDAVLGSVDHRS